MQEGFGRFSGSLRFFLAVLATAGTLLPSAAAEPADLLEADQAFKATARLAAGAEFAPAKHGIDVEFRIAPGYYLYRDRLRFELVPPTVLIASPELPAGLETEDPFLGKSVIYRESALVHLPFTASVVKSGTYRVRVTAQGCAENRLCYSPFTQELSLNIPPGYRMMDMPARPAIPGLPR